MNALADHRGWLHRRVRAFEGRRRKASDEAAKKKRKSRTGKAFQWDETSYFAALAEKAGLEEVQVARKILDWVEPRVTRVRWSNARFDPSFIPVLRHNGRDYHLFAVRLKGAVELYFRQHAKVPPFDRKEKRMDLLDRLNTIPGYKLGQDAIDRYPKLRFSLLVEEKAFTQFLTAYEWFMSEALTFSD